MGGRGREENKHHPTRLWHIWFRRSDSPSGSEGSGEENGETAWGTERGREERVRGNSVRAIVPPCGNENSEKGKCDIAHQWLEEAEEEEEAGEDDDTNGRKK